MIQCLLFEWTSKLQLLSKEHLQRDFLIDPNNHLTPHPSQLMFQLCQFQMSIMSHVIISTQQKEDMVLLC